MTNPATNPATIAQNTPRGNSKYFTTPKEAIIVNKPAILVPVSNLW